MSVSFCNALGLLGPEEALRVCQNFSRCVEEMGLSEQERGRCLASPKKIQAMFNDRKFCLCHVTQFFPENGRMAARMGSGGLFPQGSELPPAEKAAKAVAQKIAREILAIARPTIHWAVNACARVHEGNANVGKPGSFVIIEPLRGKVVEEVVGGYLEDVFFIGTHSLSPDATVFVPEGKRGSKEIEEGIRALPKGNQQIFYYSGSHRNAVACWLSNQQLPVLVPTVEDTQIPCFVYQISDGGKSDQFISSRVFMEVFCKDFCEPDCTPMAQAEKAAFQFLAVRQISLFSKECPEKEQALQMDAFLGEAVDAYMEKSMFFAKSENQKWFLTVHAQALTAALRMSSYAKDFADLEKMWGEHREPIENYDAPADLNREVIEEASAGTGERTGQATARKLANITGLPFKGYQRRNCNDVVDALVPLEESYKAELEGIKRGGFPCCTEMHKDPQTGELREFFALKGLNFCALSKSTRP